MTNATPFAMLAVAIVKLQKDAKKLGKKKSVYKIENELVSFRQTNLCLILHSWPVSLY